MRTSSWHSLTPSSVISQAISIHDTKNWDQFEVIDFQPKEFGDYDLDIKIDYCGVCGSDVRVCSVWKAVLMNDSHIDTHHHWWLGWSYLGISYLDSERLYFRKWLTSAVSPSFLATKLSVMSFELDQRLQSSKSVTVSALGKFAILVLHVNSLNNLTVHRLVLASSVTVANRTTRISTSWIYAHLVIFSWWNSCSQMVHTYNSKYPNVCGHFPCDGTSLTWLHHRGTLPRVDIPLPYAHMNASRFPFQRNLPPKRPHQCSARVWLSILPLCVSVQGETPAFCLRPPSDISSTVQSPGVRVGIVGIGGLGFALCCHNRHLWR